MNVETPAPSLSIPPWFPPYLEKIAFSMYRGAFQHGDDAVAIVKRMVTDPRMESVWDELTKKNHHPNNRQRDGSPKKFAHQTPVPEWLLDALPSDAVGEHDAVKQPVVALNADERDQRIVMRLFFQFIVNEAVGTRPIPFRDQGVFDQRRHQNEAASLRADAGILRKRVTETIRLSDQEDARRKQQIRNLVAAVSTLETLAAETEPDWKKRNEWTVKNFVGCVGTGAKMLFGSVLYSTVATIATISFEQEIAPGRVRDLFRSGFPRRMKIVSRFLAGMKPFDFDIAQELAS
jgi:hypothetical protein